MKPRCDSVLFKLTPDQQEQLYQWIHSLGYQRAKEKAALPPPDGFGVRTHLNSLHRFVRRYSEILQEREFFDILRVAKGEIDPDVLRATQSMTHQLAFELAATGPRDLNSFRQLVRWVMHLKDEQLRGARAELDASRLKLEFERIKLRGNHASRPVTETNQ